MEPILEPTFFPHITAMPKNLILITVMCLGALNLVGAESTLGW